MVIYYYLLYVDQILRQVYPVDASNVDDELVASIQFPSQDPNAAEVFYRVVSENGNGPPIFVDDLLRDLNVPLMLLWGIKDPWIRPQAAERIQVGSCISLPASQHALSILSILQQSLFPAAKRVDVEAGHCPHDEAPEAVNRAIQDFMAAVHL